MRKTRARRNSQFPPTMTKGTMHKARETTLQTVIFSLAYRILYVSRLYAILYAFLIHKNLCLSRGVVTNESTQNLWN